MTLATALRSALRAILGVALTMLVASTALADPANPADPRVVALATSLGNSPSAIFQHVRDNVGIEIYNGSLRGARGVLASKAGNALDRASLTIALLRAANPAIEARYVQGTLASTDADALVARMLSDPSRILGCSNPAPLSNYFAQSTEAANHYWVEYRVGSSGAFTALDTAFATALSGQTFAVANQTFATIPGNLRHATRIRMEVETFTQAAAAFGLGIGTSTVLDQSFESADLVDRSVTVSHFVNAYSPPALALTATQNTYSPYLTVGDSRTQIANYEVVRGTDYSEILTNFPLGNILVTGIFVVVDVTDAAGQTQSYRRPMYDRIGYVTRTTGGPVSIDPASLTRPVLSEIDVMTLAVSPSRQALDDFGSRKSRLQALQTQIATLQPLVLALPPPGLRDATQEAVARDAAILTRYALIATNELALASFLGAADRQIDEQSLRSLTRAYIASPRITIAMSRNKTDGLVMSMDIRKNDLRVTSLPGISIFNARNFERNRGLGESILEGQVLSNLTGDPNRSISSVLTAQTDASRYRPITSANLSVVDSLNLSAEAKLRIQEAVRGGLVVMAPLDSVSVAGAPVTAWLETNPNTGYTISTLEDGSHGALVEYAFSLWQSVLSSQGAPIGQIIGRVNAIGVFGIALTASIIESIAQQRPFSDMGQQLRNTLAPILKGWVQSIKAELDLMGLLAIPLEGPGGLVKELLTGLIEGLDDMTKAFAGENGDPPLPTLLFSSAVPPLPAPQAPGATRGLTLSTAIDTRFTIPFGGSEFPGVYLVRAVNTGPAAEVFAFTASGFGAGLTVTDTQYVLPRVRIGAGATYEFHVCVQPTFGMPATGAAVSVAVTGWSIAAPQITASNNPTFTTPATSAVSARIRPNPQTALAGDTVPALLTVDSIGNQAVNVALTAQTSAGLTVSGLPATVNLAAGESRSLPLTANIAAGTAPGTDLNALVTASFGGAFPVRASLNVTVTSAISRCVAPSSVLAAQIGRANLAALLGALATDVDLLAAQPASDVRKQAVLSELSSLIALLNAPYVSSTTAGFSSARATLAAANSASVGAALTALDTQFCALKAALQEAYGNGFRVYLNPAVTTNLPNANTRIDINIFNDTTNPRAMNLAITGVPSGVTAAFNTSRVVVPASNRTNSYSTPETYLTFSNGSTALAFDYQIVVTPEDDPVSVKSTAGQLTVRPEVIRVVDVTTNPTYGNAGTSFTPTVRLLSAVNDARDVFIRYRIRNRNNVVTGTSAARPYTFAIGDNVLTVPLNAFPSTGAPDGPHTIEVVVSDATDNPIPGATGTGSFFIGQPLAAGIVVSPSSVAPGTSTVNVSLNLDRSLVPQQSIKLRSTLGLAAGPLSFAQNGNYLYVCQNTAVTIVNVSNPDAPVAAGTFASTVLTNGAPSGFESVDCNVYNDRLIVGFDKKLPERSGSRTLAVYDISGGNATSPVLVTPTPIDTGKKFGNGLRFVGSDGYMTTALFVYNPFSNFIFEQRGNLLKWDFSSPNAPTVTGNLYPAGAGNPPENQVETGGPHFILGVAPHTSNRALIATTSGTGDFFNGVGRLLTIDTSQLSTNCPGLTNPCIISTLDIPQARLLIGVASQGTAAVAAGDTQGYYDLNSGYTGNLTLSAVNLSNPSAPTLSSTLVTPLVHNETYACNPAERKGFSSVQALTNNYYAIGAYNPASCAWALVLIDANDPANLRFIPYDMPDSIGRFVLNGNLLYAITASSVLVFDYTAISGPSITANVVVPTGVGVALVPGSFNLAPSSITSTATTDTYTWLQPTVAPITWQATVSNMQPGSSRNVANGGSIGFALPTLGSGTLTLGAAAVTANHIISISPASHSPPIQVGAPATFTITLSNTSSTAVTYSLAVQGVPASWIKTLAPSVTVSANSSATTPLILQTPIAASGGVFPFRVVATAGGAIDAAVATLANYYAPDLGSDDNSTVYSFTATATPSPATGSLASTTTVTVRLTNTGTSSESYYLGINSLPGNIGNFYWDVIFPQSPVAVAPGEFVDIKALVYVPNHAVLGMNTVVLNVFSGFGLLRSTITVPVNVVDAGVSLAISPSSGSSSTPFVATVTNLASVADTFDLAVNGPLGPTVTAASNVLALAAGASSTVNLVVGNAASFARPGTSSFGLLATSRASSAPSARATATVTVPAAAAVSIIGQPANTVISAAPVTKSVNVLVQNLGNTEGEFSVAIVGTTGAVTAQLIDSTGVGTNVVGNIAIPAFTSIVVRLTATISGGSGGGGAGAVTVRATSQSNASTQATTTITFSSPATCNLDIDGDGVVRPNTDGLLIARYLLGLSGAALIEGAYNPAFGTVTDITSRLGVLSSNNWLDIDGNGQSLAASDGVLLLRALFGLTGTAVTDNAFGAPPQARSDWAAIRGYLNTTCQLGLQ